MTIGPVSLVGTVARYFGIGFLGVLVPGLIVVLADIGKTGEVTNVSTAALFALVAGAAAGGLRAVVAAFPIFTSDNEVGASKGPEVGVPPKA